MVHQSVHPDSKMEQLIPVLMYFKSFRSSRPYKTQSRRSDVPAETRLAARRAARAEAREIRMRELEKQQKEADQQSDRHYELLTDPVRTPRQTATRTPSHGGSSYSGSRRSSEDSIEMDGNERRDLRHQLTDLEDKFRKAMVSTAQLDNEKSTLLYQVDTLKDDMEENEENYIAIQKDFKDKCREYDFLKRDALKFKEENAFLKAQLEQRDKLIEENGLVVVEDANYDEINSSKHSTAGPNSKLTLVTQASVQLLQQAGEGSLDVRLKKFAEEKQDLLDQLRRLKLDLDEERQKNVKMEKLVTTSPQTNGPDSQLQEIQREAQKAIGDYKFKLQKAEQELVTMQGNIARLDSQVLRYKTSAETSEKTEDELKVEKRKLQRELREAQSRIEELETSNAHLQKRIDKLKSTRNAVMK